MSTFEMLRLSSFVDSWDKQAVPSADFDTHMIHTFNYIHRYMIYMYIYKHVSIYIYIWVHVLI